MRGVASDLRERGKNLYKLPQPSSPWPKPGYIPCSPLKPGGGVGAKAWEGLPSQANPAWGPGLGRGSFVTPFPCLSLPAPGQGVGTPLALCSSEEWGRGSNRQRDYPPKQVPAEVQGQGGTGFKHPCPTLAC